MQAALERAIADLVYGPAIDSGDVGAVRSFLSERGVAEDDLTAILDSGLEPLLVYRRLIRGNLAEAIRLMLPRAVARLGDAYDSYLDSFFRESPPKTHYLRDVAREFLDHCEAQWLRDDRVAPFLIDLARHEYVQIELGAMQNRPPEVEPGELELDRPVRFIEAARVTRYDYAIHRLPDDEDDRAEPTDEPTALFVYRDPEHTVRYLELTPLAADILDRLLAGEPLQEGIVAACQDRSVEVGSAVVEGTARLLADLAERGALLGAG